jgi:DNA-binding NarL/FixJ family response regulator
LTLPTVVVCDSAEKSEQIVDLVNSQPDLALVETVSRDAARQQISDIHPKLVWLELAPEPTEAIALLGDLKDHNPATYFLVSYDTLSAELVKASMQLGADYLDAQSWQEQLPEAISRVLVKEKLAQEGASAHSAAVELHEDKDRFAAYQDDVPSQNATIGQIDLQPPGWPAWVVPGLALVLLLIFVLLQFAH